MLRPHIDIFQHVWICWMISKTLKRLQATLDVISSQLAESNKMKEVLQKGFDNMQAQLIVMKDELVKIQKELRKSQREAKKYRELYEVLRDEK